jgi:sugar lactone lactonase YvrE
MEILDRIRQRAEALVEGTFASGTGACGIPTFDYYDRVAEENRGRWYVCDGADYRELRVEVDRLRNHGRTTDLGPALSVRLGWPEHLACDHVGRLHLCHHGTGDGRGAIVSRLEPSGGMTRVAGTGDRYASGDGGPAIMAGLEGCRSIGFDAAGNLYILEYHHVRRVSVAGVITTLPIEVDISRFDALAVGPDGDVFLFYDWDRRLLRVSPSGAVSPMALPTAMVKVQNGALAVDAAGDLYLGCVDDDSEDGQVFRIGGGEATMVARLPHASMVALAVDGSGAVYLSDPAHEVVHRAGPDGHVSIVAGTGSRGFSGDGGPATSADLHSPHGVAADTAGCLYIADHNNYRVRRVDPDGIITTVAGVAPPSG